MIVHALLKQAIHAQLQVLRRRVGGKLISEVLDYAGDAFVFHQHFLVMAATLLGVFGLYVVTHLDVYFGLSFDVQRLKEVRFMRFKEF